MYRLDRPRRRPGPLLILGGLLLGLILAAAAAPRVGRYAPDSSSGRVSSLAPIRLTFSQPMDQASVEARLEINPARPGRFAWTDDETLEFLPQEPWPGGSQVHVYLAPGARSLSWLPMWRAVEWDFTIGNASLAYLWPADGKADLYLRAIAGQETEQLTQSPLGVVDFTTAPDGVTILYSQLRQDGGSDLRLIDLSTGSDRLLFSCQAAARCQAASISNDGRRAAFELIPLHHGQGNQIVSGPSQLWVLDLDGDGGAVSVGPPGEMASLASWSPRGWLAYFSDTRSAIIIVDLAEGSAPTTLNSVSNDLRQAASWSADGAFLVMTEMVFLAEDPPDSAPERAQDGVYFSHLIRVEVRSGANLDLSGEAAGLVEDASPAYSPDGAQIAFARKYLDERWSLGRQIWLMNADGSRARQLTFEPDFNHSNLIWAPDGRRLLYMRFDQAEISQPAEIWMLDVESGAAHRLASAGYLPAWIP
jgi:Tol biopolymer transport system component